MKRVRAGAPSYSLARRDAEPPRDRLTRILETPHLARLVPRLPPASLHRVIQNCGLADCGELVALATPEQLSAVFDLDLWRSAQPGREEQFDAARFVVWLEVLAESGAGFAAQRLAEIDATTVIAALARYLAVFDLAAVDEDHFPSALRDGVSREIGGYIIAAKRLDSWDTIMEVLLALEEQQRECFHRVMQGCRRLSYSKPELDGFHDLMDDSEQALFDLAVDREHRQEQLGYVAAEQARAFLQSSRQSGLERENWPRTNPIATAYMRVAGEPAGQTGAEDTRSESGEPSPDPAPSDVSAFIELLRDAGVLPDRPRALLGAPDEQTRTPRLAFIQRHMELVRDHDSDAYTLRTNELTFLANVLVAGCSIRDRPFATREAFDAAVAICNLGLENWASDRPEAFLADHDLTSVFQIGWAVLYKDVCVYVTEQLLGMLASFQCTDREIQLGLLKLRRDLTRHLEVGAPWRARDALDVIAILDLPAWAALLGLIAECPVMLAHVNPSGHSRPHSIDPTVFEFISENRHILAIRAFMQSLPDALSR
jgi:hypothetical protein